MHRFALVLLAALAFACKPAQTPPAPAAVAQPAAAQPAAPAPVPAAAPAHAGEPHAGCPHHAAAREAVADTNVATANDPATGATIAQVGGKLAGAQLVKASDLVARPREFAGKTVRLEGNVSSMCFHKRDWFSVQDEGRDGAFVRVIASPAFLVPEGSVGKKARTEGVVEVIEVDAEAARHYAKGHQLGDPKAIEGNAPVKSVVLRATGAEFL